MPHRNLFHFLTLTSLEDTSIILMLLELRTGLCTDEYESTEAKGGCYRINRHLRDSITRIRAPGKHAEYRFGLGMGFVGSGTV